ncbi:MAG: hypothetical protein GF320_01265 [Armatimonadia bacterium]|nr:hypothetical protein [Armatimonadia bacterium]
MHRCHVRLGLGLAVLLTAAGAGHAAQEARSFRIEESLDQTWGGLFAHDLDGDGELDFVFTGPGFIAAYDKDGNRLWHRDAAIVLFPYTHHPSAIAGDMDGDGQQEVGYLDEDDEVKIVDGATGEPDWSFDPPGQPRALVLMNARGEGDRDILLQMDQTHLMVVDAQSGRPVWGTQEYRGIEHSPAKVADLDGDGRDEVAGAVIIDDDSGVLSPWDPGDRYRSMDSLAIADVIPGLPLEVVMAEQLGADSHTVVLSPDELVWSALNPWDWEDPDKVVVGDFDPGRPGLEIFNRSSGGDGTAKRGNEEPYSNELAPWVLDSSGELISKYHLLDKAPEGWTGHGIEEIFPIDWDGSGRQLIAGTERHTLGRSAIIEPITGEFVEVFDTAATRLYVVDLEGDAREEVVAVDEDGTVHVFGNPDPSAAPGAPSPWTLEHYRRGKQNWNYYSP